VEELEAVPLVAITAAVVRAAEGGWGIKIIMQLTPVVLIPLLLALLVPALPDKIKTELLEGFLILLAQELFVVLAASKELAPGVVPVAYLLVMVAVTAAVEEMGLVLRRVPLAAAALLVTLAMAAGVNL